MKLNKQELATVLAALRFWQSGTIEENRCDFEHFDSNTTPLDDDEIDDLCERINCGDANPTIDPKPFEESKLRGDGGEA